MNSIRESNGLLCRAPRQDSVQADPVLEHRGRGRAGEENKTASALAAVPPHPSEESIWLAIHFIISPRCLNLSTEIGYIRKNETDYSFWIFLELKLTLNPGNRLLFKLRVTKLWHIKVADSWKEESK